MGIQRRKLSFCLNRLKKKKGVIKLSDSLKKQKEEKKDPKKKKEIARRGKRQNDEDYLKQPSVQEAINVAIDLVEAQKL